MQSFPKNAFLLYTGFFALLGISTVLKRPSFVTIAFLVFALLWFASAVVIVFKQRVGFFVGNVFTLIFTLLPIYMIFQRVIFVVNNGAIDDENSSPLAFLIGFVFDLLLSASAAFFVSNFWKERRAI